MVPFIRAQRGSAGSTRQSATPTHRDLMRAQLGFLSEAEVHERFFSLMLRTSSIYEEFAQIANLSEFRRARAVNSGMNAMLELRLARGWSSPKGASTVKPI